MNKGLDCGTGNFLAADENEVSLQRNAFLTLDSETTNVKQLKLMHVPFIQAGKRLHIIGKKAYEYAQIFNNKELRRPMAGGILNPTEQDAFPILKEIIKELLGKAQKDELVVYSVPGKPIDKEQNIEYHEDVLKSIIESIGFKAKSLNEAVALAYIGLADDELTGISISLGAGMANVGIMYQGMAALTFSTSKCLSKNFLISTLRGLIPISEIIPGDICIDNRGHFTEVKKVINNGFRKTLKRISVKGYSEYLDLTEDHKVFVKSNNEINWNWKKVKDLVIGDKLGVPIIKSASVDWCRNTYLYRENNKDIKITNDRNFGKFLGYLLGDGNIYIVKNNLSDGRISCSFNEKDSESIEDYINLIKILFKKDSSVEHRKNEHCKIVKIFSKNIAKSLKDLIYLGKEKYLNIPTNKIPNQMALGIIDGLFRSDGYRSKEYYHIENTSSPLILLLQELLHRFGIHTTFTIRSPRIGGINNKGQQIIGEKIVYRLDINNRFDCNKLEFLILNNLKNLKQTESDFIKRKINNIETIIYEDEVFDLEMDSDSHCFSSPGGIFHNCGDWIDENVARDTGISKAKAQYIKEDGGYSLIGNEDRTMEQQAIKTYYEALIRYLLANIAKQFESTEVPNFPKPVPIVIGGGTSMVRGFIEVFREQFKQKEFPINISEIKIVDEPLTAVARGCLIEAQLEDNNE